MMTNNAAPAIRAIPTEYKGVTFRSRAEARWAVFFDGMGTEWEYEPEGYQLEDAGWYLPDFWLPIPGAFLEVKPQDTDGAAKAESLCRLTGKAVFVTDGPPKDQGTYYPPALVGYVPVQTNPYPIVHCDNEFYIYPCPVCRKTRIAQSEGLAESSCECQWSGPIEIGYTAEIARSAMRYRFWDPAGWQS